MIKGKITKKDMLHNLSIYFKEEIINVVAMLDTGNLLKEPITGKSVIVVEKIQLYKILPENILDNISNILNGENTELLNNEYLSRFKIIPFSSLGKQNGMLLGFVPDKVVIEGEKEIKDVVIGIYEKSLTKNGAYTALIGLDLIEGRKKNEYISSIKV